VSSASFALLFVELNTNAKKEMTENQISEIIIREAIHIHKKLGPGLLESVYERCLFYRLTQLELKVSCQYPIPVVFEEVKLDCGYRADIIVEDKVIIEIKSVEGLSDIHRSQALTYLRLTGIKLGLLINFNVVYLKDGLKRIVNNL
jgi:GxxExxY protein